MIYKGGYVGRDMFVFGILYELLNIGKVKFIYLKRGKLM